MDKQKLSCVVGMMVVLLGSGCAFTVEPEETLEVVTLVSLTTVESPAASVICESSFPNGYETVAVQINEGELSLLRASGHRTVLSWDVEHPVVRLTGAEPVLLLPAADLLDLSWSTSAADFSTVNWMASAAGRVRR